MAWYRCECGFITQVTPRPGNVIASVNHLHRSARVDGTSAIVRMEESRTPLTGWRPPHCGGCPIRVWRAIFRAPLPSSAPPKFGCARTRS